MRQPTLGADLIQLVAEGASFGEILADYPDLQPEDIQQALAYAAWLEIAST